MQFFPGTDKDIRATEVNGAEYQDFKLVCLGKIPLKLKDLLFISFWGVGDLAHLLLSKKGK